MPNEFKVRNGLIVDSGGAQVTGSLEVIVNSNVELQVLSTGVRLGNAITDSHVMTGTSRMTGSLVVTGSITAKQTGFNTSGIFTGDSLGGIALTTTSSNGFSVFTLGGALQIYDNVNAATRFTLSSAGNISVNAITASGIVSTDNVGIGVSSPTTKLHVDGTVRIDNQGGSTVNIVGSATPNNYYGGGSSGGANYLSDPVIWLKINLDGTEYYFPGY